MARIANTDTVARVGKPTNMLPKTGQTVSYATGDDGYYEAGYPSSGRFEVVNIGGDLVVKDYATRLMWPQSHNVFSLKPWSDAIEYCNDFVFAGFSDWRLANRLELISIIDHGSADATPLYDVFENQLSGIIWTSTTAPYDTTQAFLLVGALVVFVNLGKTTDAYFLPCRSC